MRDAIVVGCGIIGATVAAALRKHGLDVLTLDDGRPLAGTPPSGGHLKPSWFGDMKKAEYEPALKLLDECWGIKEESFTIRPVGVTTTVYRVDTDTVLAAPRTVARVTGVEFLHNYPLVKLAEQPEGERCRLLVIATGAWAPELINDVSVTQKQGVSFRIKGTLLKPFIRPWAPYKQVVAHQQAPGEVWVGDGSAILPGNWTEARTAECRARCRKALGGDYPVLREVHGLRPYCEAAKGQPCLLRRLGPRAWLATGAGKLGTIAAGWVAHTICNQLP